ncbi:hypothetical protein EMGBD2_05480 [Nitrospirota bacterium]|nr:hypothetical protein EMGBD2_05480 [Nitrospirota bacterium]
MHQQGRWIQRLLRALKGQGGTLSGLLWAVGLLSLPALAFGADIAPAATTEYRDIPYIGSRNLVWVVAQLHLLLAGFVLGVPIFAWVCEVVAWKTGEKRYDKLAKEFTKLLTSAYATTALFGGILLFLLISFYPKLMNYLTDIFFPSFIVYCLLFLVETATLYLYWYGWDAMQDGGKKKFHIFLGFLLNFFAFFIMIVPNSWATFQASPVVLAEGSDLARAWAATWNPTWWPVNIHRLIANVVLGGYICGAYAGIRYLSARNAEERDHYDWMGYVGNFIGVFGLLPLPFAGYWLMREVYQYNQQMGITLMGGFLSWLFILQAMLIGVLFLGSNYYFWLGITYRIPGSELKYRKPMLSMLIILLLCLGVWMTPHSLVASLEEARKMGGTHLRCWSLRRHVGENDRVEFDDPRHFHELHHVLARGQGRDRRMGEGCQGSHEFPAGPCRNRRRRPGRVGLLRAGHCSHQLLLDVASVDRALRHVDNHAADGFAAEERQDDDGNGLGQDAASRRLRPRPQCDHGHPAHDADGLRQVVLARPLACVWRAPGFIAIRIFAGARVCGCDHGFEYICFLHDYRVYLLGSHDER